MNGRSAESNESRESKKRNQKILAKKDSKILVYPNPTPTAPDILGLGPALNKKREQMIYIEKKDLATDTSLQYFQHQQSVYSIPSGQDGLPGFHGTSISSFVGMSEEKQLKKIQKIEEDQMKRIEIREMDGDRVIEYEAMNSNSGGSHLYEKRVKSHLPLNNQHQTYCFFENTNQSQSNAQIQQIAQNKTFNDNQPLRDLRESSTFNHEEQDEIDLLICSEKATDINLNVERTISLKSPVRTKR